MAKLSSGDGRKRRRKKKKGKETIRRKKKKKKKKMMKKEKKRKKKKKNKKESEGDDDDDEEEDEEEEEDKEEEEGNLSKKKTKKKKRKKKEIKKKKEKQRRKKEKEDRKRKRRNKVEEAGRVSERGIEAGPPAIKKRAPQVQSVSSADMDGSAGMSDGIERHGGGQPSARNSENASSESDDEGMVGPTLPTSQSSANLKRSRSHFGGALLPGEGAAIAAFVEQGERIPRRGEVGMSGLEIAQYEALGYIMSGSRHARMNAVRLRKENQVQTAEEKRALQLLKLEEKEKRDRQIVSEFRSTITSTLRNGP